MISTALVEYVLKMGLEINFGLLGVKWQRWELSYQIEKSMKHMESIDFLPEMRALFKQNEQKLENSVTLFS